MPAPITYQGVVAQDGGGGGVLFKDLKFWVAHRIPNRLAYVKDIENNGGKVILLDKNADYLIADHLRQDAPLGSYSYEFIEHALETGSLDDADDFLCKPRVAQSGRTSASASASAHPVTALPKGTKTRYTPQDDMLLTEYVAQLESKGARVSGNEIYKRFEAKYPHHTWNSWRDRWVKKLRYLPRPGVSEEEPSSSSKLPPAPSSPGPSAPQQGTPIASQGRTPLSKSIGEPRPRARFTSEEDDLLWQCVQEAAADNKPINGNVIYQNMAYHFPQHTFHSWRDRALKVVIPGHQDEIRSLYNANAISGPKQSLLQKLGASRQKRLENNTSRPQEPQEDQATRIRGAAGARLAALRISQRNASPASQSAIEEPIQADNPRNYTEKPGNRPLQQQSQSPPEAKNKPQPDMVQGDDGYEPDNLPNSSPTASPTEVRGEELPVSKRLEVGLQPQFYRDYSNFLETEGGQAIPWRSIRGRAIELWDLWKAVISQKVDPSERDWQLVAEALGFNWIEDEAAPEEIRMCYENNLANFEEAMLSFQEYDGEDDDEEEEEEEEENEGSNDEEAQDQIEEVEEPIPSSPPILSSLKRPFDTIDASNTAYPHSSPKRRKLDRNQEVPSTPDEINGTSRLRYLANVDASPTKQANMPRVRLASSQDQMQVVTINEEEDELRDQLQELPALPRPRHRQIEPETQDFHFDPDTQKNVIDEAETQVSITPSQQLRLESDMTHPETPDRVSSPQHRAEETVQATTTTPRRKTKTPFQQDESDDQTPRDIRTRNSRGSLARPSPARPSRSLPKSWAKDRLGDIQSSMPSPAQQRQQQQSATPPPPPRQRKSPSRSPEARTAKPAKETPDDIIDRFLSLGYTRAIVLRALKATTWHIGNAGQVMEILRRGEALPQRTSGVWTQRDDDALKLVDSEAAPNDAKGEKKRAKELRRLQAKHGAQGVETRRQYLNA